MRFGMRLRELSRQRRGLAVSAVLALVAAVWSVANVHLAPPGLSSRSLQMATASTQVMVDSPKSALLDLNVNSDAVQTMTSRALLVGTLVATPPVEAAIARSAGIPVGSLQVQAPSSPAVPQPRNVQGRSNGPLDLVRTPNQYRVSVTADPIVPFLNIYAQAPNALAAQRLANGTVDGLRSYLRSVAASQQMPANMQVELRQFGRSHGAVINGGVDFQVALLTFIVVFAMSCAACVALSRMRRGWRLAAAPAEK